MIVNYCLLINLCQDNYDDWFIKTVYGSPPVTVQELAGGRIEGNGPVRLTYRSKVNFKSIAKAFRLMDDFKVILLITINSLNNEWQFQTLRLVDWSLKNFTFFLITISVIASISLSRQSLWIISIVRIVWITFAYETWYSLRKEMIMMKENIFPSLINLHLFPFLLLFYLHFYHHFPFLLVTFRFIMITTNFSHHHHKTCLLVRV